MGSLKITYDWLKADERSLCNDCDDLSVRRVKYPKLKPITVCNTCYYKYYSKFIENY